MSEVHDAIAKENAKQAALGRDSTRERLEELERERVASELYRNPLWLQYWNKKKANTQRLRDLLSKR